MKHFITWLKNNNIVNEEKTMIDGGCIVFIPIKYENEILKHLKRCKQKLKIEYRANYTWLAIYKI